MKVMKKILLSLTIACMAVVILFPMTSEAAVKPKAKVTLSTTTYTYNGKTKKPSVKVRDNKGKTIKKSYYKISYSSGRKNVGTYKVKVTFKKKYKGSVTKTFKIIPKKTSLSSVKDTKNSITVKWKKQSKQASGYQIQYTTDKKFKKGVKTTTVSSYKTTSKTIKKLSANKKYYVRIRTYKKVGKTKYYSGWSSAKSVTVRKPHTHKYTSSITKQPTCSKTGIRTYKCSCGAKYTKSIAATGKHTWNSGAVTKQPTCTSKGVKTYRCKGCGAAKTETVAATGKHKWVEHAEEKHYGKVTVYLWVNTVEICNTCGKTYFNRDCLEKYGLTEKEVTAAGYEVVDDAVESMLDHVLLLYWKDTGEVFKGGPHYMNSEGDLWAFKEDGTKGILISKCGNGWRSEVVPFETQGWIIDQAAYTECSVCGAQK